MDWLLPQSRLVVKTALKLLLVFVEYSENNAPLFIQAVNAVASATGQSLSFPFSISQPSLLLLRPPPQPWLLLPFLCGRYSSLGQLGVHPGGEEWS